jgi:hypothetical protein
LKRLALLLIVFINVNVLNAQVPGNDTNAYPVPASVTPGKGSVAKNCAPCLIEKFYPIGWSKDGKFAYALEPPDQACGCYIFELFIRDLEHDSILWHYFYMSDANGSQLGQEGRKHKVYTDIGHLWKGESSYFTEKLSRFDIIGASSNNEISSDSGNSFSLEEIYKQAATSEYGYKYVDSAIVLQGNKMLMKACTKEYKQLPPLRVLKAGLIKNPYNGMMTILLGYASKGWEGPPDILTYRPMGYFFHK